MIERTYSGTKPAIDLPKGTIDTQMHAYVPGFPALPGGPGLPPEPLPTPSDYEKTMEWLGIDRVVVTQGNAHQFDNSCLLACLQAFGNKGKGVAVVTGQTTDDEMERLSAAGIVGARIMDLPGGAVGLDRLEEVDERAAAFGWMMAIQFDGSHILDHFERLAALKSRWVLDHHGKFFAGVTPDSPQVDAVKRLIDKGKTWFKFAGCYESSRSGGPNYADIGAVARELAAYAPERIVWGTNWPHNAAKRTEDYPDDAALLQTVLGWFPDDKARHLALVENPEALFGFERV
ncbi:amidohydrolase family protein [Pelagibacterium sp. 26DY04]|uniref:amidohydrolase family protein n=1 Tax=Pelagibacterium sp. 26DY04 TaxID=2967130 RepID=UPI00281502C0|nr:amidohydrolase family protein [Pelagibacterium sp. 26DY04]WMT88892.1 amidohydrolase family protein [Pelagibacterium sp. 26DY04]